jgi:ubiquinone/menaquinone biosynthesis C-methylase UbiE
LNDINFDKYFHNILQKYKGSSEHSLRTDFEIFLNEIKEDKSLTIIQESIKEDFSEKPDFTNIQAEGSNQMSFALETLEGPEWYKPTRKFFIEKLLIHLKGNNVLELGVGDGAIIKYLPMSKKVGIDINDKELAKAKALGIAVMKNDLNTPIPIESKSFDNIICVEVLEHIFKFQNVLNEAHRILKPGGTFAVGVPYHGTLKNIAITLTEFDKHYVDTQHIKFFTPKRLKHALSEAGFEVVEESRFGRIPYLWRVMFFICCAR